MGMDVVGKNKYMVLTCMAYGCMTIRMIMHELQEKREKVLEVFLGAIERDERVEREFEIGEEDESQIVEESKEVFVEGIRMKGDEENEKEKKLLITIGENEKGGNTPDG